jgi:hypothetical protein
LGVDTTSPVANLHVNGSNAKLRVGPFFVTNDRDYIELIANATDTRIVSPNERFNIDNPSGDIIINPSGNVGIVTTSPGSRLQIQGSGTTSATSALNVTNSTPTSLLFVRDDGNVGIGTSSPLYPVVIANRGPSGTPQRSLAIGNTATNGTFMYLGSSASTSGYNLIQSITTEGTDFGNLVLQPEAGNVGVATTSPQAKLHVAGTVRIDSTSSQPNTVAHNVELLYTNTAIDNVAMGEPDVWLQININGTVYAIPAYAPA